jgi:hypothetical protein
MRSKRKRYQQDDTLLPPSTRRRRQCGDRDAAIAILRRLPLPSYHNDPITLETWTEIRLHALPIFVHVTSAAVTWFRADTLWHSLRTSGHLINPLTKDAFNIVELRRLRRQLMGFYRRRLGEKKTSHLEQTCPMDFLWPGLPIEPESIGQRLLLQCKQRQCEEDAFHLYVVDLQCVMVDQGVALGRATCAQQSLEDLTDGLDEFSLHCFVGPLVAYRNCIIARSAIMQRCKPLVAQSILEEEVCTSYGGNLFSYFLAHDTTLLFSDSTGVPSWLRLDMHKLMQEVERRIAASLKEDDELHPMAFLLLEFLHQQHRPITMQSDGGGESDVLRFFRMFCRYLPQFYDIFYPSQQQHRRQWRMRLRKLLSSVQAADIDETIHFCDVLRIYLPPPPPPLFVDLLS